MEILVEQRGAVGVLSVSGSVDGVTSPALAARFHEEITAGRVKLVGDLAGVEYMSSAGLRALLETVKEARQHGGDLRLAAVRPDVLRVLDLSGFTKILKLYDDAGAAALSFGA
jgi:anti-sigma B factor antagonist